MKYRETSLKKKKNLQPIEIVILFTDRKDKGFLGNVVSRFVSEVCRYLLKNLAARFRVVQETADTLILDGIIKGSSFKLVFQRSELVSRTTLPVILSPPKFLRFSNFLSTTVY